MVSQSPRGTGSKALWNIHFSLKVTVAKTNTILCTKKNENKFIYLLLLLLLLAKTNTILCTKKTRINLFIYYYYYYYYYYYPPLWIQVNF